jgi:hypothetical protein
MSYVPTLYDPTNTTIDLEVVGFSAENLADVLSNPWVKPEDMMKKKQFDYLRRYLERSADEKGGLDAKTIVVESPYVSQSYLSDYADYYARGFAKYSRFCKRVHFFSFAFSKDTLNSALTEEDDNNVLWNSYLGYIVVKPLPDTPIGATLLKTYSCTSDKQRHYPAKRPYPVNLLGKKLEVDTLIFQEQDANVSACATTALWMTFHKTAYLFQTPLPSPYQITASTGNLFLNTGRSFPTVALDRHQVGKAIDAVGLVAELRNYPSANDLLAKAVSYAKQEILLHNAQLIQSQEDIQDEALMQYEEEVGEAELTADYLRELVSQQISEIKGFIYAYLRLGLPVVLFLDFCDGVRHLVTVTGYREAAPISYRSLPTITLLSNSIERFYVHDDQIGPFARLGFTLDGQVVTEWPTAGKPKQGKKALLESVTVPLIRDIRIQYEQVYAKTAVIDQVLYNILNSNEDFVWDIYLEYSNKYKEGLFEHSPTDPEHLGKIQNRLLPKYIWVARATLGQNKLIIADLVFDATDLHTGFYCVLTNIYEPARTLLMQWLQVADNQRELLTSRDFEERFLDLLLHDLNLLNLTKS